MAGVPPQDVAHDTAAALYAANLAWAAEKALAAGVRLVIEPLNPRDAPGYLLRTQRWFTDGVLAHARTPGGPTGPNRARQ